MANGYLGKISAIVTANTSELSRNLNAGAKDVRAFAQGVSRDINRFSSDAQKQFAALFTPLQRFERGLQAAASQKLSFKGFDGAIKTVEQLRGRIASLKDQRIIDLAVKTSGLSSINELRNSIADIGQREVRILTEVGGLDKVRALREEIQASDGKTIALKVGAVGLKELDAVIERFQGFTSRQLEIITKVGGLDKIRALQDTIGEINGKTVVVNVGEVNAEELDLIAKKLSGLDNRTLKLLFDVVGDASLEQTSRSLRQLVSASEQIVKPLNAARAEFDRLPIAIQAGFINALVASQNEVDKLKKDIDDKIPISEQRFTALERTALRAAAAMARIGEAARLAQQGPTGGELVFRAPRAAGELQANAAAREAAMNTAPAALARDAGIGRTVSSLRNVATEIAKVQSEIEGQKKLRIDTSESEAKLERLIQRSERLRARLNQSIGVAVVGDNLGAVSTIDPEGRSVADRIRLRGIERDNARNQAAATAAGPQGPTIPPGFGGDSRFADLGKPIEDSTRQLDRLKSVLVSVKGDFDSLPASMRTQLIPAIQQAEKEFQRLAALGPEATAKEIEDAANKVDKLRQQLGRAAEATKLQTFKEFSDQFDSRRAVGELQGLQQVLVRIAAQAGGPAAEAYDRYGSALSEAIREGTVGLPAVEKNLDRLQKKAIDAIVATGRISRGAATRIVQRGGDVAAGAAGNAGLAVQQAVFAFEDFFSVTGGLDQRIRAAGNNLSQLGVILGGTTGLVIGVSAAITGQLIAALIKWYNAGVDVQDNVKALNDSLARQRGLAEDLANAFNNVADAIASAGFSKQNQELRERQKLLDDISNKQNEQQRERIAGLDPTVQRERAVQAARQRELDAASDPGERVRLTREIRDSQRREREAADRAVAAPGIDARQAVQAVGAAQFGVRQAEINQAARAAAANSPSAAAQQRIEQQRLADIERARQETAAFEEAQGARIAGIRDPREQVKAASELIDQEQQRIQSSITTGFAGFFDQGANQERRRRLVELEQARANLEKDVFRAATNKVAIEATKTAIEAARGIGAAQELLQRAIGDGASQTRKELDKLNQSLLDAEKKLQTAQESGDVEGAKAAQAQIDTINNSRQAYESAAKSVSAFADVLDRVSSGLASTVASEARGRADQSRRDSNRASGVAGSDRLGGLNARAEADFRLRQRRRAEQDARDAEDRRDRVNEENDRSRRRFERDATAGRLGADTQRLVRQRDEAQAIIDSQTATEDERAAAIETRNRANRALDRAFEDSPAGRAASRAADEADREAQRRRELESSIDRGRSLRQTPAERAANEVSQGIQDIANSIQEDIDAINERGGGRAEADRVQEQGAEALSRFVNDQARAAAPAIFSLADSVANALLQGPSRAALNATDVSTVEGQRELNRLLRGDDSARDVNLVELEKQSQLLEGIKSAAEQTAEKMGIVLNWS